MYLNKWLGVLGNNIEKPLNLLPLSSDEYHYLVIFLGVSDILHSASEESSLCYSKEQSTLILLFQLASVYFFLMLFLTPLKHKVFGAFLV